MPRVPGFRRAYTSNEEARAIYQSTDTYDEMVEQYDASYDVIRDIRCARGRWAKIVAGLTKGKTHGRNGHGEPRRRKVDSSELLRSR